MAGSTLPYGVMLARQMNAFSDVHESTDDTVDFYQALNTALCFLCWINADSKKVVEPFLRRWPEALILEGTTNQDCARCIVKNRMKHGCLCATGCNKNRNLKEILNLLTYDFSWYQQAHIRDLVHGKACAVAETPIANFNSTTVFPELMKSGRHMRRLALEESSVHSQVVETSAAKAALERELERELMMAKRMKARMKAMYLSIFSCGSEHAKGKTARLENLKLKLEMSNLKLASVKREHKLLVHAINHGHRSQYDLLKRVFSGCERHECASSLAMNRECSILDQRY